MKPSGKLIENVYNVVKIMLFFAYLGLLTEDTLNVEDTLDNVFVWTIFGAIFGIIFFVVFEDTDQPTNNARTWIPIRIFQGALAGILIGGLVGIVLRGNVGAIIGSAIGGVIGIIKTMLDVHKLSSNSSN